MSTIRRKDERKKVIKEHCQGGPGQMIALQVIDSDAELYHKGRLFNEIVLAPGSAIGYHMHQDEEEIYVILSGEGEYDDNGTKTTIHAGDVTFTGSGEGHGLLNTGTETLYLVALIVYQ